MLPCPKLFQPPSGGCVLKQLFAVCEIQRVIPAAFGRLCVETRAHAACNCATPPAAFGRLCVETRVKAIRHTAIVPAAFGRLCVETPVHVSRDLEDLPAAFGRLCVETFSISGVLTINAGSSRLRAAVC